MNSKYPEKVLSIPISIKNGIVKNQKNPENPIPFSDAIEEFIEKERIQNGDLLVDLYRRTDRLTNAIIYEYELVSWLKVT